MAVSSLSLLASNSGFRGLWLGATLSVMGDAFTKVAFIWFVYDRTQSPAALSALMVFYTGPLVIGGLCAGFVLDRFNRVRVMIIDALVRAAAIGMVPILHGAGVLEVWHVYLAAAVYGFFMMISLAGTPTLIPTLVAPAEINAANSLETLSYSVGGVAGPALAGLLIATIGAPLTVLIDVASYLAFALALSRLDRSRHEPRASAARAGTGYGSMLHLLVGTPILLATTTMFFAFNIGKGAMNVWLPVFADTRLAGGPELFGVLLGVLALGETAGALYAGATAGRRLGLRICLVQAATGAALLIIALEPSLAAAVISLVLLGAFSAPMTVWAQTLRMQIIPTEQRGRAFALLRLMMQAGNPAGAALAGMTFAALGVIGLIAASAAAMGLPGAAGLAVGQLRRARR